MLLERLAADRPVVFTIDDLQWAEPKFLELVEHVSDFAQDAPILLACMARPELLDDRPGWAGGKLNATSILIEPLGPEECGTLVANLLADDSVDEAVRSRIAVAAEGHPLYAEEITGLLVDEGRLVLKEGRWFASSDLSDVPVPPTISALLAARLDTLPSQERRLIAIASVMGQVFYSGAVHALANDGADEVDAGITSLVRKQFVRPERSDVPATEALAFRHLLIRDAAYDAIPKATRAELHETFADWLDDAVGSVGERDEIVGYHLEQAYRYRTELGPLDDRATELGRRAGEHLGDAGLQAFALDDMSASAGLLDRAVRVLPPDDPRLPSLEDRLATSLFRSQRFELAAEANLRHIRVARSLGDRAQEQRAELCALYLRFHRSPQDVPTDEARRIAHRAIDVFEALGDEEGLADALAFLADLAINSGRATEAITEAEASLDHALRSHATILLMDVCWPISWPFILGPTPAGSGLARLERFAEQVRGHPAAEAAATGQVAGFLALLGRFDEARATARKGLAMFEELGHAWGVNYATVGLGEIEWFAGNPRAAEEGFRRSCDFLRGVGNEANLADAMIALAELLVDLGRDDEVLEQTDEIASLIMPDDAFLQSWWRRVRSVALARLGHIDEATALIVESERLVRSTEFVTLIADTMRSKAEVLKIANRREDAVGAAQRGPRPVRGEGVRPSHRLDPDAARLADHIGPCEASGRISRALVWEVRVGLASPHVRYGSNASVDGDRARRIFDDGRLARLQGAMRDHGMDACLFFKPSNVRYSTGTSVMATYCLGNHVRCALVPAEGAPILFEHPGSTHISGRIVEDVRVMHQWEYADDAAAIAEIWADQIADALRGVGGGGNAARDRSAASRPARGAPAARLLDRRHRTTDPRRSGRQDPRGTHPPSAERSARLRDAQPVRGRDRRRGSGRSICSLRSPTNCCVAVVST